MKRTILARMLSLALCAVLVCAAGAAAVEAGVTGQEEGVPTRLGPVQVWGSVTRLENGSLFLKNSNENDPNREIVVHPGDAPYLDAVSGLPLGLDTLKDGDVVYAWVGPAMMLSLPPQASAVVIVGNIPADYAAPQYYQAAAIAPRVTAAIYPAPPLTEVTLTTTGGDTLTITDQAQIFPYLTKNVVGLGDLRPGTQMLVWSDAEGAPVRVMLFPYGYRGYASWSGDGKISLNDETLSVSGKADGEGVMHLPIRAVAEALGLEVSWESGKGAVVKDGGQVVFTVLPGEEPLLPEGETASYGVCTKENGTTYLPAVCLLSLLNLFRAG